jgi:hypothetical protein
MVRQAHHERNQPLTVRPELVEGLSQRFLCIADGVVFEPLKRYGRGNMPRPAGRDLCMRYM